MTITLRLPMTDCWELCKRVEISCSHHIDIPGYEGKCKRPHGHNYIIEVTVVRNKLDKFGMIADFGHIKEILNKYDHQDLNLLLGRGDTTAEMLSQHWATEILNDIIQYDSSPTEIDTYISCKVWETENSSVQCDVNNVWNHE